MYKRTGNLVKLTNIDLSYATCIRQALASGVTIGNVTKYSPTTSKHQRIVGAADCDIVLDDVPRDTPELFSVALARGLVTPAGDRIAYISQDGKVTIPSEIR